MTTMLPEFDMDLNYYVNHVLLYVMWKSLFLEDLQNSSKQQTRQMLLGYLVADILPSAYIFYW